MLEHVDVKTSEPLSRQRNWRDALVCGLFILLAWQASGGYASSDDAQYLTWARRLSELVPMDERVPDQTVVRMVVWIPAALLSLLGPTVYWAAAISGTLFGLTIIVCTLCWPAEMISSTSCRCAAVLLSCSLIFMKYVPTAYPEVYMTAFFLLALVSYRRSLQAETSGRRLILVGIFIGLGTLAKQPAVLLFPVLVIDQLRSSYRTKNWMKGVRSIVEMGAGGVFVFVASVTFLAWWIGRPFYLFEVQSFIGDEFRGTPWYEENTGDYFSYFWMLFHRDFSWIAFLALGSAVVTLFDPRGPRLEAVISVVFFIYLNVGSVSLSEYVRPTHAPRYLIPCLPLWILCLTYQSQRIWATLQGQELVPRWFRMACPACVAGVIALFALDTFDRLKPMWPMQSQLEFITQTVKAERHTYTTKGFYWRYWPIIPHAELSSIQVVDSTDQLPVHVTLLIRKSELLPPSQLREIAWRHSTIYAPPFLWRPTFIRSLIDRIRRKPVDAYYRSAPLFRIDIDMDSDPKPESKVPSFLQTPSGSPHTRQEIKKLIFRWRPQEFPRQP